MITIYTPGNSPEDSISDTKPIREKKFSVIGFRKHSPPEYHVHCRSHIDLRLIRLKNTWYCPTCGPSVPAVRIVETEETE